MSGIAKTAGLSLSELRAANPEIMKKKKYKQEYLGTLLTADTLYGAGALRTGASDSAAVALAVPA